MLTALSVCLFIYLWERCYSAIIFLIVGFFKVFIVSFFINILSMPRLQFFLFLRWLCFLFVNRFLFSLYSYSSFFARWLSNFLISFSFHLLLQVHNVKILYEVLYHGQLQSPVKNGRYSFVLHFWFGSLLIYVCLLEYFFLVNRWSYRISYFPKFFVLYICCLYPCVIASDCLYINYFLFIWVLICSILKSVLNNIVEFVPSVMLLICIRRIIFY